MIYTTLPRATVEQALEALGLAKLNGKAGLYPAEIEEIADAITALRAALAQQAEPVEPVEPVAWVGDPSTQDYASTVPDPQIEDRLARHGIPMPEAPACPDCHGVGYDASGQLCACQENPSF